MWQRLTKELTQSLSQIYQKNVNLRNHGTREDYNTKDGTPIRDFIHVSDLVDMHLIASEYLNKNEKSDIFKYTHNNNDQSPIVLIR